MRATDNKTKLWPKFILVQLKKHPQQFQHVHTSLLSLWLTLNCTQVLRSASKFASGHRVERSAFGTFSGSHTAKPSQRWKKICPAASSPISWPKGERRGTDRLIRLAGLFLSLPGLAMSSGGGVQVHASSPAASERRAKGGMGDCRHRPPHRSAPTTLTPPSSVSNALSKHALCLTWKLFLFYAHSGFHKASTVVSVEVLGRESRNQPCSSSSAAPRNYRVGCPQVSPQPNQSRATLSSPFSCLSAVTAVDIIQPKEKCHQSLLIDCQAAGTSAAKLRFDAIYWQK